MSGGEVAAALKVGFKGEEPFELDANLVVTGRTCVLDASGSGKSYAVGVLCEELCRNNLPFAMVDTEGEYSGLREKFEAVWIGEEEGCDISWAEADLEGLARQAPDTSPLILDVSDLMSPRDQVGTFLSALYKTLTERRTPYLVILEEADRFVPQYGERLKIFDEVARRGRKRGLGLMVCSQRPSLVDKNILSQCGNQLIGKLIIQNDLKSVAQFFPGRGLPKELTTLRAGQFFAMGGFSPLPALVTVRKRETRHGGVTPTLGQRVVKPFVGGVIHGQKIPEGGGEASETAKQGKSFAGLAASVKPEDVPMIVKRQKRFGFFGAGETVTSVELLYRTMIQLGVRLRTGVLRRRYETLFVVVDGSNGREVVVDGGLELRGGFERLLGLSMLQVEVLREVRPDEDTSAIDVASRLGESRPVISRALTALDSKRLVRTIEVRRNKLYRRMVDLPGRPVGLAPLELGEINVAGAKVVTPKLKETDIRDAVKGLWEGGDLDSFETFLYPFYRVELTRKRRRRQLWLDGRTGKEIGL